MSTNVTKVSALTLLGPQGTAVTKGSLLTLVGPRGATATKVSVVTLLSDEFIKHDPPPQFEGVSRGQQRFLGTAERNATFNRASVSGQEFENRTIVAGEFEELSQSDNEFFPIGGTNLVGHNMGGMTLLSSEDLQTRTLSGFSLLSSEKMEAKAVVGLSLLTSEKMEIKTTVAYSLLGPPIFTSKTPIKGPPRIVEAPRAVDALATKVDLPDPPQQWDAEWGRRLIEQMKMELEKRTKAEEANHSQLLRDTQTGKIYEVTITNGELKITHKAG